MFDLMRVLCDLMRVLRDLCIFVIGKMEKYDFFRKNKSCISNQSVQLDNHWILDILIKAHRIHTDIYGSEAPSANIE